MLTTSWLQWFQGPEGIGLVFLTLGLLGALVGVTALITRAWRRVRESENRAALVSLMLQRGMSAADIERVMKTCVEVETEDVQGPADPESRIIALMKENLYTTSDVERVLDAARKNGQIDLGALEVIENLVEQGVEGEEIETLLDARAPRPARPVHAT